MRSRDIIRRARGAVGVPFRPQGRTRDGLDCVGLVRLAYRVDDDRGDYRLSGAGLGDELRARLEAWFRVARGGRKAGDLLLMRVAARQWHLGVWTGESLVHADARRRAVVERPGAPEWPVEAVLRRRAGRRKVD